MKKYLAFFVAAVVGLTPAFAMAQVGVTTSGNATVGAGATTVGAHASSTVKLGAAETKAKDRGDQEIDRRIMALNDLSTRVSQMQKVSDQFKQNLTQNVQAEVSTFNNLKAKIDADTDVATLKTDIQSVTQSYRIFALVIPQGRISAAADRVVAIVSMMNTLGAKLQARIQAGAQAGNDVTALTAALTDMGTKLSDAQTQAQNAVSAIAGLQPDNGDKTKMAANTATLKQGHDDIVTATKDLAAARKDVGTIIAGLAKFHAAATASSTTQVQTTTP